ncbi:MAG: hypothetical protein ACYCVD_15695 [Desulfitobacteriaceae bacterium]
MSRFATEVRYSWLRLHLDAHTVQTLGKRAYNAASRVSFGKAKKIRFKGKRGIHSLEGKSLGSAIKWRDNQLTWSGIQLPMVKHANRDKLIAYSLE